jgi:electron transfer flavoprotein alpha subunit
MSLITLALIAEVDHAQTHPAVLDLAALGREFAETGPVEVRWLVVGNKATEAGRRMANVTGYPVSALEIPPETTPTGELLGQLVTPFLKTLQPEVVALLHTFRAQDYAAALAIALEAVCLTAIQGLAMRDGNPVFQRSIWSGKWLTEIQTDGRPVVLTVLPGFFKFEEPAGRPAAVETCWPSLPSPRVRRIETRLSEGNAALSRAETIVAAGRGIGSKDNLELIFRLAALLPRSAVAGSRIVCDAGWMPCHRQVGLTGATVAPALYLACGISGAFQHLAGMKASKFVVAVNSDPQAAIFNAADVGVVEDLATFLPLLIEALEKNGSGPDDQG